jgi:uncharacterized protein YkwD
MRTSLTSIALIAATAVTALAAVPAAQAADCGPYAERPAKATQIVLRGTVKKVPLQQQATRITHCLINNEREAAGVPPLRYHALLSSLAHKHSRDIGTNGYHVSRDPHRGSAGSTVAFRLKPYTANFGMASYKIAETVTENPNSSPATAVRWWMQSDHHRPILLDPELEDIGVGVHLTRPGGGRGATYTADFGTARNE